jgi:hypothetical protein
MQAQKESYPDKEIPIVLPFLADAIIELGGLSTEGIWRIPGDNETLKQMKARMNRGHYQLVSGVEHRDNCVISAPSAGLYCIGLRV